MYYCLEILKGQTDVTKLGKLLISAAFSWYSVQKECRELC